MLSIRVGAADCGACLAIANIVHACLELPAAALHRRWGRCLWLESAPSRRRCLAAIGQHRLLRAKTHGTLVAQCGRGTRLRVLPRCGAGFIVFLLGPRTFLIICLCLALRHHQLMAVEGRQMLQLSHWQQRFIEQAQACGATLACVGKPRCLNDSSNCLEPAVQPANDSQYALAASLWREDFNRHRATASMPRIQARLDAVCHRPIAPTKTHWAPAALEGEPML